MCFAARTLPVEDKATGPNRLAPRLGLYLTIVGPIVLLAISICQADIAVFINVFVVAPLLLILTIPCLVFLAIYPHRRRTLLFVARLAFLWAIAISLFLRNREHPFALHETAKWLVWSREYKQEVLKLPSANGDLKHIEWDRSGFVGVANNTAYLVFDPSDSPPKAKNGRARFDGKSCNVRDVRRLQRHWYAVLFYTDETWDECN